MLECIFRKIVYTLINLSFILFIVKIDSIFDKSLIFKINLSSSYSLDKLLQIQLKYFICDILNDFGKFRNLLKLIEIPIRFGKLKSLFGRKLILLLSKSNFLSKYNLSILFGRRYNLLFDNKK